MLGGLSAAQLCSAWALRRLRAIAFPSLPAHVPRLLVLPPPRELVRRSGKQNGHNDGKTLWGPRPVFRIQERADVAKAASTKANRSWERLQVKNLTGAPVPAVFQCCWCLKGMFRFRRSAPPAAVLAWFCVDLAAVNSVSAESGKAASSQVAFQTKP